MAEEKEKSSPSASSGSVPFYTPFPSPTLGLTEEQIKDIRRRGQRFLFINVVLMFFISIVVFVIGTFFFVVPRMVFSHLEIMHAESKIKELQEEVYTLRQTLEEGGEKAATATSENAQPTAEETGQKEEQKSEIRPEQKR